MNKVLHVPIEIKTTRYPTQQVLSISVHEKGLQELCLGLCLLSEGLIELLVISDERGKSTIRFRLGAKRESDPKARVGFKSDAIFVELTPVGLRYAAHFLLRYYRDGVSDVDHIDLEATDQDAGSGVYITLRVDKVLPSVSPEEAERRLRKGLQ